MSETKTATKSRSKYFKQLLQVKEWLKQAILNFLRADRILKSLGITRYNDDITIAKRNGYIEVKQ